jgi:hypothetical protein
MLNNLGDGSTLSLDFTTGVLDPRLTFTRSTTGTFINSSGYVTSAAINAPRFDYDPTTLAPRGLLIESASNNLLNWSESFASSGGTNNNWADTSITRTTGQTDPANGTTAIRFTASAGNATVISTAAIGTSAQRTFSIWLRRVTGTGNIQFTTDNGATWTTQAITASWVRYTFAATTAAQRVGIRIVTSADAIEMWGAQLENGNGSSSYISTGASQGSRAADSCVMTGTNFSSWFAGATEGVFYAEYEAPRFLGGSDYFCLGTVYAAGTFIGMNLANSTRYPQALISPGGGFRVSGGISVAASTPMKHAAKWSGVNNVLVFANGAVGTAHSATSGTPTLTMFSIGSSSTSGTAATGDYLNACVRRVKFWPVALPNSQIIAITT